MQNISRFFHFHEGEPWQRAVKVSGAFLGMLALSLVSASLATVTSAAQETPRARVLSNAETIQRYPAATPLITHQAFDPDYDGIRENDACPNTPWELIAFRTRTKFVSPITGATTGLVLSRMVDRIRTVDIIVGNMRTSIPLNGTKSIAGYQVTFTTYISPAHVLLIRPTVDTQGCTVPPPAEPVAVTPTTPPATNTSASTGVADTAPSTNTSATNAPASTTPTSTSPPSPGASTIGREFPLRSGDFTITPVQEELSTLSRDATNQPIALAKFNFAATSPTGSRDVVVIDEVEMSLGFEGASLTDVARNTLLDLIFPSVSNGTPVECGSESHWSNRYRFYDQDGIHVYGSGGGYCDRATGRVTFKSPLGSALGIFTLSDSRRRKATEFRITLPSFRDAQFAPLSRITPSITRVVYHMRTSTATKYELSLIPIIPPGRRVQ